MHAETVEGEGCGGAGAGAGIIMLVHHRVWFVFVAVYERNGGGTLQEAGQDGKIKTRAVFMTHGMAGSCVNDSPSNRSIVTALLGMRIRGSIPGGTKKKLKKVLFCAFFFISFFISREKLELAKIR